jgi:hypothetical protein
MWAAACRSLPTSGEVRMREHESAVDSISSCVRRCSGSEGFDSEDILSQFWPFPIKSGEASHGTCNEG